jgi:hypothetical protein
LGRKILDDPRHTARHTRRVQVGHVEPGVDHEDLVRLQGCSRLGQGPTLQSGFAAVTRVEAYGAEVNGLSRLHQPP